MNYEELSLTEKISLLNLALSLSKAGYINIPAVRNDPEEIIIFLSGKTLSKQKALFSAAIRTSINL
jgi:hypothetical protein